ncbi:cytochrome c biogenesis protein CcsA [bacterium]|nr:cytochrome c biogenesis protein CcsA [bacterium]
MKTNKLFYFLIVASFISTSFAIYSISMVPAERTMGVVYKIFYFHMPSAVLSMILFFGAFITAIIYLIKKNSKVEFFTRAFVEVGVLLATFVIISGPLWAKKAWGVYWTWDPRLTFTLMMWLIYLSYIVLRASGDTDGIKKGSAILAILGFVDIPLVKISSQKWGGIHPVLSKESGGFGISGDMQNTLILSFISIVLISSLLIYLRYFSLLITEKINKKEESIMLNS